MCGFVGVLSSHGQARAVSGAVDTAARLLRHRGPDEHDTWCDDDVAMAFHRLTIVDLHGSGQPFRTPDGRYTVVFNGEIYNYRDLRAELSAEHGVRFAGDGEAETLAAAHHVWGEAAVERLRGMFAFLIWDRHERVLVAARDPFGIKPLYLSNGPAGVAFASEKKSLLALDRLLAPGAAEPPTIDHRSLQHYLSLQYVPEPATMHTHVRRVESGTVLRVRPGGAPRTRRYFTPTFQTPTVHTPTVHPTPRAAGVSGRIAAALEDSVTRHLQADVPVGALLSGGIDSTAIVALAARQVPDLVTFTVGIDRPGYSEIDAAAESAAALGVQHVARTITAEDVVEALPRILWHLDDPVADPALVPLWFVAEEARRHVSVVLSGEGADELFGGYAIYREPQSLAPIERLPASLKRCLARVGGLLPEGTRGKDLLRRGTLPLEQRYSGNARIFRDDQLPGVLRTHDPAWSPASVTAAHYRESAGWDPVSRMQHVDLFTWLRGDILVKADRMTMAHSLELRTPFLDPAVLAVASELAPEEKLTRATTKHALRQALRGIVPAAVVDRPKLGFPVPVGPWLRHELHDWARQVVRGSGADHLVDLQAVTALLDAHRRGDVDHGRRLWAVLVLLVWHAVVVEREVVLPHGTRREPLSENQLSDIG